MVVLLGLHDLQYVVLKFMQGSMVIDVIPLLPPASSFNYLHVVLVMGIDALCICWLTI